MSEDFRPAALLLHLMVGRPNHFDLLFATVARPKAEERCAICWRTGSATHALLPEHGAALEPIELHRALYLDLREPRELDENRGRVEPLARGRWRPIDAMLAELAWTPHGEPWILRFRLDGRPVDPADAAALASANRIERVR